MTSESLTDGLPKCQDTSVAFYQPYSTESWNGDEYRCFYIHKDDLGDIWLYGLFDAHNGNEAANFVLQRMVVEIIFGGLLNERSTDEQIKEVLKNAFLSVEKAYIESIDVLVAERTSLQYELPEGVSAEKLTHTCGNILERLKQIDEKLSNGATAVVALIYRGKLYVANIGNNRALLCKTDENCVLRVVQLSVDHSLSNEDELLRLSHLGLDINQLRQADMLGNQPTTRCLGNYLVKGIYKAFPDMRTAPSEPIIAIPEVHGPIILDDSCRFLVLVSDGLYKNLQESTDTEQVNKRFAQMIVEQFRTQPSLKGVCQAVVDQTMAKYLEYCSQYSKVPRRNNRNTLLIRNFNFQLPNDPIRRSPLATRFPNKTKPLNHSSKDNQNCLTVPNNRALSLDTTDDSSSNGQVRFNPIVQSISHDPEQSSMMNTEDCEDSNNFQSTIMSELPRDYSPTSTNSNTSSELRYSNNNKVPYDKDRKIEAYVDFSDFYANIEAAKNNGLKLPSFLSSD